MSSIDEALGRDHAKLGEEARAVRAALLGPDWETAAARFASFSRNLRHHIEWEENVLFPALHPRNAGQERHIASLLIDHERIRKTMDEIGGTLAARSGRETLDLMHDLELFLAGHNDDEERGAYEDADRILPEADRREMIERFQAGP